MYIEKIELKMENNGNREMGRGTHKDKEKKREKARQEKGKIIMIKKSNGWECTKEIELKIANKGTTNMEQKQRAGSGNQRIENKENKRKKRDQEQAVHRQD